ncbi:hypothetical protein CL654_00300 [bacterium]|nr:hypothetical protein [bacterium]|tara:strand:+ start:900 stop:1127 length:228 start_codon:yes stop_codon:yes gene_type:complete
MLIKVRVLSESKKEEVKEINSDTLVVQIKEKPERNRANKKIVALLNSYYNITSGSARIITGHKSAHKIIEIPHHD